ncbi:hypothetical protein WJX72_000795 [[Myrmecia] bisecta]|uniref:AB hydrolase-1 domain-containing protein n=1 Tax=[Myrmecia] bisecta TaxID=41462 RepID=A0AAW1Q413_9CHLO
MRALSQATGLGLAASRCSQAWTAGLACLAAKRDAAQQASRGVATIAHDEITAPGPSKTPPEELQHAAVIHGLLGSGRNWRTFSRRLANDAAAQSGRGWLMSLVDQRNHGSSSQIPDLKPPHTIQASAGDLQDLVKQEFGGRPFDAVVGHSMGGKTALEYLRQTSAPGSKIKPPKQVWVLNAAIGASPTGKAVPFAEWKVWVLDAAIGASPAGKVMPRAESDVEKVVKQLSSIPMPIPSREWLYDYLGQRSYSPGLAQWLGSNLVPIGDGQYRWAFNIKGAADMLDSYYHSDYWDLVEAPPPGVAIHHVRAANSDRWTVPAKERLQAAQQKAAEANTGGTFTAHLLPDAGHWLHVDNPDGLRKMMLPSFITPPFE